MELLVLEAWLVGMAVVLTHPTNMIFPSNARLMYAIFESNNL